MKTSSYILIPATTFGNDNGETYDGIATEFSSNPQKAAAYYSKDKSVQTVSWHLTDIVGVVTIEATLDTDADTANYFPIHTIDASAGPSTIIGFNNLEGNYTWIRVTVSQYTAGSISKIVVGY